MEFEQHITQHLSRRTVLLYIFLSIGFLVVIVRLWELQLLKGAYYFDLSKNNRIKLQEIVAPRGIIFDRAGKVLADNVPSFDISLLHEGVGEVSRLVPLLSTILGLSAEEIALRVEQGKKLSRFKPIKIKKDVSRKELGLVEFYKLDLPNIVVDVFPKRHYPSGEAACHILGRLGEIDEETLESLSSSDYGVGDTIGKAGVEKALESHLRGKSGWLQFEVDALGRKKKVLSSINPVQGNDVHLTIDLGLQLAAHNALGEKHGAAVALDPNTGDILAYVSHPCYDPNLFSRGISPEEWSALINNPFHPLTNKPIQGCYPPGSVFKIITALAGLEEQKVNTETTFFCRGVYDFAHKPRCWKKGGHGSVDFYKALEQSCDVYFYSVGQRLGIDAIAHYARLFGLGQPTGIILDGEKKGLIPTSGWKKSVYDDPWQVGETLSASIGQSFLLVTPLQIGVLMAAVANNGSVYAPRLVTTVATAHNHTLKEYPPSLTAYNTVSLDSLAAVKEALRRVVQEPGGTGKIARIPGFELAGKTGTAQVVRLPEDKKKDINEIPYQYRDHAWFAAFAPFEDPVIAVAVLVEHGGFGSSTAGPIARDIIHYYLKNSRLSDNVASLPQTLE